MAPPGEAWFHEQTFDDPAAQAVWVAFGEQVMALTTLGWQPDDVYAEYRGGTLIVGIDESDAERRCGVRTLRADFDGRQLLVGEDPTYQFVTDFRAGAPGVQRLPVPDMAATTIARAMVAWFQRELERPVYREEWDRPPNFVVRWVLGDDGRVLCWSSQANAPPKRLDAPARRTLVAGQARPAAAG